MLLTQPQILSDGRCLGASLRAVCAAHGGRRPRACGGALHEPSGARRSQPSGTPHLRLPRLLPAFCTAKRESDDRPRSAARHDATGRPGAPHSLVARSPRRLRRVSELENPIDSGLGLSIRIDNLAYQ